MNVHWTLWVLLGVAAGCIAVERWWPAATLARVRAWWPRVALVNLIQLGIVILAVVALEWLVLAWSDRATGDPRSTR